jgi:hypothetical protein
MPRVNDRRVAHKSTGGIPPKIPTPVGSVGNAPNHLTPNTIALSANQSSIFSFLWREARRRSGSARCGCCAATRFRAPRLNGRHSINRRYAIDDGSWRFQRSTHTRHGM